MEHYNPNHWCDRCGQLPSAFEHLPSDEGIFLIQMRVGNQWNGEYYHMCNGCMRNYITDLRIVDGPSDDDDEDEEYHHEDDEEMSDPTPTDSDDDGKPSCDKCNATDHTGLHPHCDGTEAQEVIYICDRCANVGDPD